MDDDMDMKKAQMVVADLLDVAMLNPAEDILSGGGHLKSKEKKQSMVAHFNYFLQLRSENIKSKAITGRDIKLYEDITFQDLDKTKLAGEFATYLAKVATSYQKKLVCQSATRLRLSI